MDENHVYPNAWRFRDYVVKAFNDDMPFDSFIREQIAGDLLLPPNPVATGFLALGPKPSPNGNFAKRAWRTGDALVRASSA